MSKLHIKPEIDQLPLLYAFGAEHGIDDQAMLALEEATVNVVTHSCASYIDVSYELKSGTETFVIEDDGEMFDPTAYSPDVDPAEQLITGGQGIRLVRSMTDSMHYRRVDNKNILTLVKTKSKQYK